MTTASLTEMLEALRNGVDPSTGEVFNKRESCLSDPSIRKALNRFIRLLVVEPELTEIDISDAIITETCAELRQLGYKPSVMQVAKVFIGSRSIVDQSLKSLRSYNRYRGKFTRQRIHTHLMEFSRREPDTLPEFPQLNTKTVHQPWREIDFFQTEAFHKLDTAKETELRQAVAALGLRKDDNRLPEYMAVARQTYPRSFEPWVREEQALLIEAMCYTNNVEKLAAMFGRSIKSIEATGQKLIWDSQQQALSA